MLNKSKKIIISFLLFLGIFLNINLGVVKADGCIPGPYGICPPPTGIMPDDSPINDQQLGIILATVGIGFVFIVNGKMIKQRLAFAQ